MTVLAKALGINATIEAARAGTKGQECAVVPNEIHTFTYMVRVHSVGNKQSH